MTTRCSNLGCKYGHKQKHNLTISTTRTASLSSFTSSSQDDLIKDALFAIRDTLQDEKLTSSIIREEAPASETVAEPGGGGAAAKEDAAPIDI
ncbi:hypothetical protein Tco_0619957 [Tanacetum coccineum]